MRTTGKFRGPTTPLRAIQPDDYEDLESPAAESDWRYIYLRPMPRSYMAAARDAMCRREFAPLFCRPNPRPPKGDREGRRRARDVEADLREYGDQLRRQCGALSDGMRGKETHLVEGRPRDVIQVRPMGTKSRRQIRLARATAGITNSPFLFLSFSAARTTHTDVTLAALALSRLSTVQAGFEGQEGDVGKREGAEYDPRACRFAQNLPRTNYAIGAKTLRSASKSNFRGMGGEPGPFFIETIYQRLPTGV